MGVEVAHVAAEGAADPLDVAVLVHARTLGVEVVHVLGPVLDGRVAQVRTLAHKELDGAGVGGLPRCTWARSNPR